MRILRTAVVLSIILVVLCGPLAAQSNRPIYLFSLEGNGSGTPPLHVFSVNPTTGALLEVPNSPFATGPGSSCIVVDPTSRFIYVANTDSNDITAYSVNASTGTLTPLPGSPYLTGNNPAAITVDPTGRFLYVSSFTESDSVLQSSNVYAYSIDSATGVLTSLTGSPFAQSNFISSITFDPQGNYVFLAQPESNPMALLIDSVNFASGVFTDIGSFLGSENVLYWTVMNPSGSFLYGADASSAPGQVGALSFDAVQESLSELQASPYVLVPAYPATGPILGTSDLVIAPSGKFLYAVNQNYQYQTTSLLPSQYDGSISALSIDPETGALTPVDGSPFSAGINPASMAVDPTGHFAYASPTTYTIGYLGYATILGFSVNSSTGALTPFSNPAWMETLPYSNGYRLAISYGPTGTSNPVPMISSLAPSSVTAGGAGFTLQVNGVNFVPGAAVYFGGQARATTYVSSTQLTADVLSADIANGGTGVVFVFNPLPGGGASTSAGFTVFNPSPMISSISPSSAVAGAAGFTLTVNGSDFVTGSIVNFNGATRSSTYISSTQLSVAILAGDIANQGTIDITVTNPANGVAGGGTSSPATLTVLPASVQPTLGTLVPASATAGGPAFTLTVMGTGFTAASVVSFNLNNVSTTYISATQLLAAIPASAIALAGNPVVMVTNPGPIVSLLVTFAVNNPPPGGGSVSPPSVPAGNAALTLSVTGTNFTPGSTVLVNGSSRVTTYVSSTLLQATLLPSDLSQGGTLNITVSNPPPGGGTTAAISFTVADYCVNAINATYSVTAGQPANFNLTVSPNGAFSNAVTFTASGLPTGAAATFSSATITPGSTPAPVTLSISTTAHSFAPSWKPPRGFREDLPSLYLLVAVFVVMWLGLHISIPRVRRLAPQLLLVSLLVMAAGLAACSGAAGGSSSAQQVNPATGTPAGTYSILISATSGGVARTTTVTLIVM